MVTPDDAIDLITDFFDFYQEVVEAEDRFSIFIQDSLSDTNVTRNNVLVRIMRK